MLTALILVGVAVGMLLLIRTRPGVEPFDPRSDAPDGASAAVLVLEKFGATVTITSHAPVAGSDERVLVIADRLNAAQRRDLLEFVDAGGVAIVADPASDLHGGGGVDDGALEISDEAPGVFTTGTRLDARDEANVVTGDCTIGALDGLRGVFSPDGLLFPATSEHEHCFGTAGHAFVITRRHGRGTIVGFGGNRVVTNEYLRYADNSGLLTSLLVPAGEGRVRIMLGTSAAPSRSDIGQGSETLADIVRPGVWMGLSQLALAFVVLCFARGVRPGRAVREPQPTPIAGNELVVATGNLMQRAQHAGRAAQLIRDEFYRELCHHHRVPGGTPLERLAAVVAGHAGIDPATLVEAFVRPVADAVGLVRLRDDIDSLRRRTIIDDSPASLARAEKPTEKPTESPTERPTERTSR